MENLTIRQVRYLVSAIAAAYDHTPGRRPDLDAGTRADRKDALQDILDKLTGAASTHLPSNGRYAIDGTAIDTPAVLRGTTAQVNGPRRAANGNLFAVGDDAGRRPGHRVRGWTGPPRTARGTTPTPASDTAPRTCANRTSFVYGYQLIAFTRVGPDSATSREVEPPALVDRIALVPGNEKGLPETIALLDRLDAAGTPARDIVVDRGFSDAAMADFRRPLAQRRIEVTLDLKSTDHGATPHQDGYLIIDGDPYCPSTPADLRTIHPGEDIRVKKPGPARHRGGEGSVRPADARP